MSNGFVWQEAAAEKWLCKTLDVPSAMPKATWGWKTALLRGLVGRDLRNNSFLQHSFNALPCESWEHSEKGLVESEDGYIPRHSVLVIPSEQDSKS